MRFTASVTDVARNFADYINRVTFRGEHFLLLRGRKPVAELRPVPAGRRLGELPALLASLPRLSPSDVEALSDDLSRAASELPPGLPRDPWES